MNLTAIILGIGAVVVLALAVLATRKGAQTYNVGDVGSKIVLPFGLGSAFTASGASTPSALVAAAAETPVNLAGAANRYGNYKSP